MSLICWKKVSNRKKSLFKKKYGINAWSTIGPIILCIDDLHERTRFIGRQWFTFPFKFSICCSHNTHRERDRERERLSLSIYKTYSTWIFSLEINSNWSVWNFRFVDLFSHRRRTIFLRIANHFYNVIRLKRGVIHSISTQSMLFFQSYLWIGHKYSFCFAVKFSSIFFCYSNSLSNSFYSIFRNLIGIKFTSSTNRFRSSCLLFLWKFHLRCHHQYHTQFTKMVLIKCETKKWSFVPLSSS